MITGTRLALTVVVLILAWNHAHWSVALGLTGLAVENGILRLCVIALAERVYK